MITQGSNLPLYFSNIPVSLDSINDISIFLCTKDGICLKYWGKDDVTVSEDGIIAPITQAESMRFPEGRVYAEIKFTDDTGTILPGIRVSDYVSKRDDRTPLLGEQPQNLRYVNIDCSGMTADISAVVGASAYEVAVRNGFEGTEEEWLETLRYDHSEEFAILASQVANNTNTASGAAQTAMNAAGAAVDAANNALGAKNAAKESEVNSAKSCERSETAAQNAENAKNTAEELKNTTKTLKDNAEAAEGKAALSEKASAESEKEAKKSETAAEQSKLNASAAEANAKGYAEAALQSKNDANASAERASESESNASASKEAAAASEKNAKISETAAGQSAADAADSAGAAVTAKTEAEKAKNAAELAAGNASASETNAKASEGAAAKASADAIAAKEEIRASADQITKNTSDIAECARGKGISFSVVNGNVIITYDDGGEN